ncbi:hypothetical protein MKW98_020831, partial [Papaver atlanticum]
MTSKSSSSLVWAVDRCSVGVVLETVDGGVGIAFNLLSEILAVKFGLELICRRGLHKVW